MVKIIKTLLLCSMGLLICQCGSNSKKPNRSSSKKPIATNGSGNIEGSGSIDGEGSTPTGQTDQPKPNPGSNGNPNVSTFTWPEPELGQDYAMILLDMAHRSSKYVLSKVYQKGVKTITETVPPGDYDLRLLITDQAGEKVIAGTKFCGKSKNAGMLRLNPGANTITNPVCIPGSDPDTSGFAEKLTDEDRFFSPYLEGGAWVPRPVREATLHNQEIANSSMGVGLPMINALGLPFGGSAVSTVSFMVSYQTSLMLTKHAPNAGVALFEEKDSDVLKVDKEYPYIGVCNYTAAAQATQGFSGSIIWTFVQSEASSQNEKGVSVSATSNFFNIIKGDTATGLQQKCEEIFKKLVQVSVDADLKKLIEKRAVVITGFDEEPDLEKAIKAAITGPSADKLEIYGKKWKVYQAAISGYDTLVVTGKIENIEEASWFCPFCDDTKVAFRYEIKYDLQGKIVSEMYQKEEKGKFTPLSTSEKWYKQAVDLSKAIGFGGYRDRRGALPK